ncbi:MAG: LemA family protein [Bacteroidaceae bacterium]|nr:LemA family protein [Bacteroidaceae bacterium]
MSFTTIVIIAAVVLITFFIYGVSQQRTLVKYDEMVNNSMSNISVQLKSRWDAVLALVKMTKGYSDYEHQAMMDIISQRRIAIVKSPEQVADQEAAIGQVLTRFFAVSERYPELKAASIYSETMKQMVAFEEKVRISRMVYNDTVTKLNNVVRQFPSNLVATLLGYGVRSYIEHDPVQINYPDIGSVLNK